MQPSSHPQPPQRPLPPIHPPHVIENYTAPEFTHESEEATRPQPTVIAPQFPAPESQAVPTHHPDYEFIMNPAAAQAGKSFGTAPSLMKRVAIVVGGLFVLLILFVVVKSLLSNTSTNAAVLLSTAQEQQELIHISTNAAKQPGAAISTLNSSVTISASITNAQQQLTAYMASVGQKVSPAQLSLKVSTATDTQLTAAAAAGTYDQTYQTVAQTALQSYEQTLKQAYAQTAGPRGRALLSADYTGAKLLLQQLSAPAE